MTSCRRRLHAALAALGVVSTVAGLLVAAAVPATAANPVGPPVFGTRTTTTPLAGAASGPTLSTARCPAGAVADGLVAIQADDPGTGWLTGTGLQCQPIQVGAGGVSLGAATDGDAVTGFRANTVRQPSTCPAGSVVTGVQGRAGYLIDQVQAICTVLNPDGTFGAATTAAAAGGAGGQPVAAANCPAGSLATGLTGHAGQDLNDAALECQSLTFQLPAPDNASWPTAQRLNPNDAVDATLATSGQELWYKVAVAPGSRVQVDLTGLPADYDLAVFKDIAQSFTSLTSTQDLTKLSAEFAGDAYSPSVFSPSVFSPSVFSPSVFSPSVFSPSVFSPSVFSPSVFSPSVFSPSVFSPSVFSPSVFSPAVSLPSVFSPSVFSPSVFSPSVFSAAFSSAQTRSLLAVSANDGTSAETTSTATWNNTGDFYIRVTGRNGAYSPSPFHLAVTTSGGPCTGITLADHAGDPTLRGTSGPTTLILTDPARMTGSAADKQTLASTVSAFAGQVGGAVVDLGSSQKVSALNAQADGVGVSCPYAKNLVAQAIRDIVNSYRGSLKYVVIVGDDHVIPFFRYADSAGLGPESGYVPPVADTSASQASLRGNNVLGQDAYGALTDVSVKGTTLPVPDLAVGRLVETPGEITATLRHYVDKRGASITPTSTLATGYDFLSDAAHGVATDFAAGVPAGRNDTLITDPDVPPSTTTVNGTPDPRHSWTATDLSKTLFGQRHDLVFLAGHFSANSALAADYSTSILTSDAAAAPANTFTDSLVFSAGCHSGYNIVDGDGIAGVTDGLDWAQVMAQKGATLIAGTGYQYGDTDFLSYGERLYGNFAHDLRYGTGALSVGSALVQAKVDYLSTLSTVTGIDQKTVLESALFGLPMQGVTLPGGRITPPADTSLVSPQPVTTDPGSTLGLSTATLDVSPTVTSSTKTLTSTGGGTVDATYLTGPDGVLTRPGEPALPLVSADVTDPAGRVLRGVGLRTATYTDTGGITPLVGSATTEQSGAHGPFVSAAFYPNRLATPNYFDDLSNAGDGRTRLTITPAQHRSDGTLTDTLRRYSDLGLSLFYSANTKTYDGNVPARAAPPSISGVTSSVIGDQLRVEAHVVGDPSAGIQQVWVSYTGEAGTSFHGRWDSIDLTQNPDDSSDWTGVLDLPASGANGVRFMVQAVNGVGLVGVDDNQGLDYAPGVVPSVAQTVQAGTTLTLAAPPASAAYRGSLPVRATLLSGGSPVAGRSVTFGLDGATATAVTDDTGVAATSVPVSALPGAATVTAGFDGDSAYLPSAAPRTAITITKAATALTIVAANGARATLTSGGVALPEKAVVVVARRGASGAVLLARALITDRLGQVTLPAAALPAGDVGVSAYFGTAATPLPSGTTDLTDPVYAGSVTTGLRTVQLTAPVLQATVIGATYSAPITVSGTPAPTVTATGLPAGLAVVRTASGWAIAGTVGRTVGAYSVTITADNGVGPPAQARVLLIVGYRSTAFAQPVNDPEGTQRSVFPVASSVPLSFQLTDASGTPIPAAEASALASAGRVRVAAVDVGATSAKVNEARVSPGAQSGTAFAYDRTANRFVYTANASAYGWKKGRVYQLAAVVTTASGVVVGGRTVAVAFG